MGNNKLCQSFHFLISLMNLWVLDFSMNLFWLVRVVVVRLQRWLKKTLRAMVVDLLAHVNPRHHKQKLDVYNELLKRIQKFNCEEANLPGVNDQFWLHSIDSLLGTKFNLKFLLLFDYVPFLFKLSKMIVWLLMIGSKFQVRFKNLTIGIRFIVIIS